MITWCYGCRAYKDIPLGKTYCSDTCKEYVQRRLLHEPAETRQAPEPATLSVTEARDEWLDAHGKFDSYFGLPRSEVAARQDRTKYPTPRRHFK